MVLDPTGLDRPADGLNRAARGPGQCECGTISMIDVFRLSERARAPKSAS